MTSDIIARYVTHRINDNAKWYANKAVLAADFSLTVAEAECYHLLQSALLSKLESGHTVLVIDDRAAFDALFPVSVLSAWQQCCVRAAIDTLSLFDQTDGITALTQSIMQLHELSKTNDPASLKRLVDERLMLHRKQWIDHGISARQIEMFTELFMTLLRMCHLFFTKIDSLDAFIDLLQRSAFFANVSPLNAAHPSHHQAPICYVNQGGALYLWTNRAYHAEANLLAHIRRISQAKVAKLGIRALPDGLNPKQMAAIDLISNQAFALITGGPGTGKTYTVAQIVIALSQLDNAGSVRLGLAAPTGKAAQRMSESLLAALPKDLNIQMPEPKTIHRLLGIGSSGMPRHHAQNPLAFDVLIIDEASMLGTELASQLFAAVASGCRVILLGDAHQLAAVDAGAVLADLCHIPKMQSLRVHLSESRRFSDHSGVGRLAKLINTNDAKIDFSQVKTMIDTDSALEFINTDDQQLSDLYEDLAASYQAYFTATQTLRFGFEKYDENRANQAVQDLFGILNQYRILCASHLGALGDEAINAYLTQAHQRFQKIPPSRSPWYHGRVVMITKNLYELGLFNGDVGICLWAASGLVVYFEGKQQAIAVDMLSDMVVSTAYAITVHKSQGSEWQAVAMVFDDHYARLLSKELIYTAVTRAKSQVRLYGSQTALMQAINTPTMRQTGLALIASLQDAPK